MSVPETAPEPMMHVKNPDVMIHEVVKSGVELSLATKEASVVLMQFMYVCLVHDAPFQWL